MEGYIAKIDGVAQTPQASNEYWVTATEGASYTFSVQAYTDGGYSIYSTTISIIAALAPLKMSTPSIAASNETFVHLDWDPIAQDSSGGSPVLFYRVYRNNGLGGGVYVPINDTTNGSGTTSMALSTDSTSGSNFLISGRQYCFTVAAMNLVSITNALNDQGPKQSDPVCAYTASAPEPPGVIYFRRAVKNQIEIYFPSTVNDNGAAVQLYEISMSTSADPS
jgi:hypothetical protein